MWSPPVGAFRNSHLENFNSEETHDSKIRKSGPTWNRWTGESKAPSTCRAFCQIVTDKGKGGGACVRVCVCAHVCEHVGEVNHMELDFAESRWQCNWGMSWILYFWSNCRYTQITAENSFSLFTPAFLWCSGWAQVCLVSSVTLLNWLLK